MKKYNSPLSLDIGVGSLLVFASVIYFTAAYIMPEYNADDPSVPCSSKSLQAVCYSLDTTTCENVWKSFDDICEEEARPIRESKPSALIYPITYRCHAKRFDKIAFYNRRNTDSPACREYFRKLAP